MGENKARRSEEGMFASGDSQRKSLRHGYDACGRMARGMMSMHRLVTGHGKVWRP